MYRGVSWIPHRLRCSAPAISHNGGVTRRPRDRMHRRTAPGIWITILYGVYLYGEKCSGITVRSLRSAVQADSSKKSSRSRGIGEPAARATRVPYWPKVPRIDIDRMGVRPRLINHRVPYDTRASVHRATEIRYGNLLGSFVFEKNSFKNQSAMRASNGTRTHRERKCTVQMVSGRFYGSKRDGNTE